MAYATFVFVVLPSVFNLSVSFYIVGKELLRGSIQTRRWFGEYQAILAGFLIFSVSTPETLLVLDSNILDLQVLKAEWSPKTVQFLENSGLVIKFIENMPQLGIQIYYAIIVVGFDPIVMVSLMASILSILFGIVSKTIGWCVYSQTRKEKKRTEKSESIELYGTA